ncbi:MAG: Gfo/Idh/MocA family oxidoreductase [Haloarcula sp.]
MAYRIGVIGTGATPDDPDRDGFAMAYRHADGYQRLEDCTLHACADIVPENAEQFAGTYDVPHVYEDYRTMLAEMDLDVISVCVPPRIHAEIVTGCAEHGDLEAIHCEKPMATTWADCREMCQVCEEAGVRLTFNHQKRVGPIYRRAKELLDSGTIGDLHRIEVTAENLFDSGTHVFDLATFYTDRAPVAWVMAGLDYREENRWFGVHNENQAVAQWRYENGVTGLATTGRSEGAVGTQVRLVGRDGTVEIGADDGPPLRVRTDRTFGWKTVDVGETIWGSRGYTTYPGYLRWGVEVAAEQVGTRLLGLPESRFTYPSHIDRAIESVIEAVREDGESPLTWRNAIESTEIIFAAWESARRRARVDLPLGIEDNPLESMVESGSLPVASDLDGDTNADAEQVNSGSRDDGAAGVTETEAGVEG